MRLVLDTNVLVRSTPASQGGPAREAIERIIGTHILLVSPPLMLELADVMRRPRLRDALGLSEDEIVKFLAVIEQAAESVPLSAATPAYVPGDPKDAALVQTALLGNANVICTRDRHLRHPQVLALCQAHDIRVLSDIDLLNELRQAGQP
jgi:uncharacterized protein